MHTCRWNVRQYGAAGDGTTKDTAALQRAIDECAAAGGGQVVLPPGRYLSGTIYLRSDVDFHLMAGAVLVASHDRDDYNADDCFPENMASARDETTGAHLLIAYRQQRVTISGNGTIDGNADAFWVRGGEQESDSYRMKPAAGNFPVRSWRTSQLVFICRCQHVAVRDVTLLDSPYWTLFVFGCEDVQLRGLTVTNPPATRNGDGIDIDCSRRVTISDCIIRTGDDCITLRGNASRLGEPTVVCEQVTVTNCVLSSPCNAIRVGVGNGIIRDCLFQNLVITESYTAISINCSYAVESTGVCIERIAFTDIFIDAVCPITIAPGPGATDGAAVRDIRFQRLHVRAAAGAQLSGTALVPLESLICQDIEWVVQGGSDNTAFVEQVPETLSIHNYGGRNGGPILPAALYGVHLRDALLANIRVRWEQPGKAWQHALLVERSSEVDVRELSARQPHDNGTAVLFRTTAHIQLRGCVAAAGTDQFVQVEHSDAIETPSHVVSIGNDWTRARRASSTAGLVLSTTNVPRE